MSPDQDPHEPEEVEQEPFDEGQRRTMFSTTWFRAIVVLVVVGVVAAVGVPYVLETLNPPPPMPRPPVAAQAPPSPAPAPAVTPPAAPTPPSEKPEPVNPIVATTTPGAPPPQAAPGAAPAAPRATGPSAPAAVTERGKPEAPKRPAPKVAEARRPAKPSPARTVGGATGDYWVQVGAFSDRETARRLVARLRAAQFRVEESVTQVGGSASRAPGAAPTRAAPAPDRYDVLVSGGSVAEINARLVAKGLAAEPAGGAVAIRPSLPLREAVALSKDLAADGLKVQVKRATAPGPPPAPRAPAPAGEGGQTLHRVRVGAFADRAAAASAARELEGRGFKPFIARGRD